MTGTMDRRAVSLRNPCQLFIGGDWIDAASSATLDVVDSATEEVCLTVAEAKEADVARAVVEARGASRT